MKDKITPHKIIIFNRFLEKGYSVEAAGKVLHWGLGLATWVKQEIWGSRREIGMFCNLNKVVHDENYPLRDDL